MNLEERGTEGQLLSIVVPVYNEQPNIEKFYMEATKAAATLDMDYELIFVDDGSKDATPLILSRLAQEDEHVRAFILARNFGHQLAITCGMDHARGDAIITMDGDLQHPPEMIPDLVQNGVTAAMSCRRFAKPPTTQAFSRNRRPNGTIAS